jgi:hypothetical protein
MQGFRSSWQVSVGVDVYGGDQPAIQVQYSELWECGLFA